MSCKTQNVIWAAAAAAAAKLVPVEAAAAVAKLVPVEAAAAKAKLVPVEVGVVVQFEEEVAKQVAQYYQWNISIQNTVVTTLLPMPT